MTLYELIQLFRSHLKLLIGFTLVAAIAMGAYAYGLMKDTYTAETSAYVLVTQSTDSGSSVSSSNLQSDLNASGMITTDVADLLKSSRVEAQVAKELGMDSLKGLDVSVESSADSRVITLSVTGVDPKVVATCANKMVESVSDIAQEVMGVESVNIIDKAARPDKPSGPRRPLYIAVAGMAGFMAAAAIIVLQDMLNTKVRSEEMLEQITELPIMGRIPQTRNGGVIHG